MKNFKLVATLLVVAVCAMFVTSCSNDDDDKNGGDLSKIIVGTWKVTSWESDEGGAGEMIGAEISFKKNGFVDFFGDTDAAKWSIRKKGETLKYYDRNIVLKYDAVVVAYIMENGALEENPMVFLIKESTSDTMSVSLLEFEMQNDSKVYSRGTLKKIK